MSTSSQSESHPSPQIDRRSRLVRTRALVLRRRNLGEADRIVTLLSRDLGKQRCVAKGVLRPGSRLAGHLEPFTEADLLIARTRSLDIISQAQTVQSFRNLRLSEGPIAAAGLMMERIDTFAPEDEALPGVYDLATGALGLLDRGGDPLKVRIAFDLGILRELGFRPSLFSCARCEREIEPGPNGFSPEAGGAVCGSCLHAVPDGRPVSNDALKLMRLIDRGEVGQLLALRVRPTILQEVETLLEGYVSSLIGWESAARRVVRDLDIEYDYEPGN